MKQIKECYIVIYIHHYFVAHLCNKLQYNMEFDYTRNTSTSNSLRAQDGSLTEGGFPTNWGEKQV